MKKELIRQWLLETFKDYLRADIGHECIILMMDNEGEIGSYITTPQMLDAVDSLFINQAVEITD